MTKFKIRIHEELHDILFGHYLESANIHVYVIAKITIRIICEVSQFCSANGDIKWKAIHDMTFYFLFAKEDMTKYVYFSLCNI